jgi:hypothetical protein
MHAPSFSLVCGLGRDAAELLMYLVQVECGMRTRITVSPPKRHKVGGP